MKIDSNLALGRGRTFSTIILGSVFSMMIIPSSIAFAPSSSFHKKTKCSILLRSSPNGFPFDDDDDDGPSYSSDPNAWRSDYDETGNEQEDWLDTLQKRQDGSLWSSFETSEDESTTTGSAKGPTEEEEEDAWLDAVSAIAAEEVAFNLKEADRADQVRQMQEWGFTAETISNTLGVATKDLQLEDETDQAMQQYREDTYNVDEEIDPETVESHTTVERDPETGDLIRTQMVYVDEVSCIGCTNCAMIAQSTFFMESEYGRARVYNQWGDDEETIATAIETCPVDCIHYVPYDELKSLEEERRGMVINFKARLVNQGECGANAPSHKVGSVVQFSEAQKISGNMGSRCSNCPTRGCGDCPMYGIGKNPEFERKEAERMARRAKIKMKKKMEEESKTAEL